MSRKGNSGTPVVSVILPTLNRDDFLREAIRTVNEQTYGGVELIVVDDSERAIRDPMADLEDGAIERLEYVHGEEHGSAGAARNTGIRKAQGEFIAFLDDDDLWKETKVERQLDAFDRRGEHVGVVHTGQRYVDEEGRTTAIENPMIRGDVTGDVLLGAPVNPFSCAMVRADTIREVGLIDERLHFWEDREWFLRLSRKCVFESIPDPLVIRRVGDYDRLSHDFESRVTASRLFLDKHRSLARSYGDEHVRRLEAWLARGVAVAAIENGYYWESIRFLVRAIRHAPLEMQSYLYLLLALGGHYTYRPAQQARRRFVNWRRSGEDVIAGS